MADINKVPSFDSLPWEEIDTIIHQERNQELIGKISRMALRRLASEKNRQELIMSALNHLQKTDPDHATPGRAANLADIIQNFAKLALESKE
jgi:hypothetical protein